MDIREAINDMGMGELERLERAVLAERVRRQGGGSSPVEALNSKQRARADMQDTAGSTPGRPPRVGEITLDNVDDCFTYHPPNGCTLDAMSQVREASIATAKTILRTVPDCPDRTTALRKLREARMWANSALALGGRF